MSNSCEHSNPLKHQGTSQGARTPEALLPENVKLHELDEEDWLKFAYDYARLINYFPPDNPDKPGGDWQAFFEHDDAVGALLDQYGDGDMEPHLALFVSFLKLLTYPQQSINGLPKKHLDYYYSEVLDLEKKPFEPDRVHVLFELAQNAVSELVDTGVELKAGKDSEGKPLVYQTESQVVVNPASVKSLKAVFTDSGGILRHAPIVNSADGNGQELEEGQAWAAFGSSKWPEAELSFYIASDLLRLAEGERVITLTFEFENPDAIKSLKAGNIKAALTGEKGWLEVTNVELSNNSRSWEITLASDIDPVLPYSEKVHKASIDTEHPVLKLEITRNEHYNTLRLAEITSLQLKTQVKGIETLQLQNELGTLDPGKPFMPFGSRPKVGSKLKVTYPEMYDKPVSRFELEMKWLNVPANFSQHYDQYQDAINDQKTNYFLYLDQIYTYSYVGYYVTGEALTGEIVNGGPPPDTMRDTFQVKVTSPYNPDPDDSDPERHQLFSEPPQVEVDATGGPTPASKGEIEVALTESFYHDLYSELYVNAILQAQNKDGTVDEVDLPNEPYTPLLDKLTLNYTASEEVIFPENDRDSDTSEMFHKHPFGTLRVVADQKTLLPGYGNHELYIGLEKMEPGSNISLLIQVAEGSENPLHSSFTEGDIDWWALAGNRWEQIKAKDFARNDTNNFLRSGVVELPVPQAADTGNTLLAGDLHWLRVRLRKEHPQSVCKFIGIHAQATDAVFDNRDNTTDHLEEGLPGGTIGKLVNPRAKLKSVSQPYPSFEGKPAETDDAFYRRVSERLRHKNRAVSIWDYEHLVLQEFPSLYKVKCLNHTYWDGEAPHERSPGNVTLVLVPQVTEGNTEFRLEPKVSQDFQDRVREFADRLNSVHADLWIANPIYEPVRFEFDVAFNTGLDYNFYRAVTIEDLKKLLAPWVFESDAAILFGGVYTEYEIVNYLENLEYIDYIENFRMYHKPAPLDESDFMKRSTVEPSNSMAILVPAGEHDINKAAGCA
ncbi:MAG: baseplate J/gp47 family protein [Balneolaceae bacterium]|nr:baseplate J/gp47 family protein [Balneolaceae bacterium]